MAALEDSKVERGKGRGSRFFAIGREVWEQLWRVETVNRLNLVSVYLVLLAGTGSDHRLTKWSARACEEHVGIGKPRAKQAIEELIRHRLVVRTDASSRLMPQYQLPPLGRDEEPIFLPVQLVTGFGSDTPILRRVRETGDALLLRMLVDLYGLLQLDVTHGVPIASLREEPGKDRPIRKVFEVGVHAVWAIPSSSMLFAGGEWIAVHKISSKDNQEAWGSFWGRVRMLKSIGAIWYEPWIFDSENIDAEPLFPIDFGFQYQTRESDEVTELTRIINAASEALVGERVHILERHSGDLLVVLPVHHQKPSIRGVVRLRVEADTPGRRLAYGKRVRAVAAYTDAYKNLIIDIEAEQYNRPLRPHFVREGALQ